MPDSHFHFNSIPDSAASSTEGSSSSSAPSSFKGTKKKKQVPGSGGDNVAASDNAANVTASKPKATQSKKSKGCQTSGGPFPYKAPPPAAAATAVAGIQKNVKVGVTQ